MRVILYLMYFSFFPFNVSTFQYFNISTFDEFARHAALVNGFPNATYFEHEFGLGIRTSCAIIHEHFDAPAHQLVSQQMHASA